MTTSLWQRMRRNIGIYSFLKWVYLKRDLDSYQGEQLYFSHSLKVRKQSSVLNGSIWCIINGNIFTGSFLRIERGMEAGIETAVSEETEMAGQQLCFLAGRRIDCFPEKWVAENAAMARFNCTTALYMTNYKWRWRSRWHPKSMTGEHATTLTKCTVPNSFFQGTHLRQQFIISPSIELQSEDHVHVRNGAVGMQPKHLHVVLFLHCMCACLRRQQQHWLQQLRAARRGGN